MSIQDYLKKIEDAGGEIMADYKHGKDYPIMRDGKEVGGLNLRPIFDDRGCYITCVWLLYYYIDTPRGIRRVSVTKPFELESDAMEYYEQHKEKFQAVE